MDYYSNIKQVRDALLSGEMTATDRTKATLTRIHGLESSLHSFVTIDDDGAMARAQHIDAEVTAGRDPGPLAGVVVAVKDNIVTKGLRTTASSRMLERYVPVFDGHVVDKLREAGAVIVGKTNLDEFAMGSSTENSAFFATSNPWDTSRVPGGSSGGSAAAVAAGQVTVGLGSDTGGSIRQPAALCGIVGVKPTWGRVSRYGLIAYASSLDQIGPMGRTVEDCALLLQTIAGFDEKDSTSVDVDVPSYSAELERGVDGLRIGVPEQYFGSGTDPEVSQAIQVALDAMAEAGAQIQPVSLPTTEHCLASYYVIAPAEASSNLARYDGVRFGHRAEASEIVSMISQSRAEGFGAEVKRRIMLGTYALSAGYYEAFYGKAQRVRTLIRDDIARVLDTVDVLATPTSPIPAFGLGEHVSDPMSMYLMDVCTLSANLAGIPALSQPCGFTASGLPIGLQWLGRPFDESTLFRVASAYESRTDWHHRHPSLEVES